MGYIIYKYTSKTSGKSYIGQTNNPNARMMRHKNTENGFAFSSAIKKYGFDDFEYEVLEENLDIDQANKMECFYIDKFNTLSPDGYNLRHGGDNAIFSDESREKLSLSMKGKPKSLDHIKKIIENMTGSKRSPHSNEAKKKIRESNLGKKRSAETRLRISQGKKNPSEETRAKMSLIRKGSKLTEVHKRKISEGSKGRIVTPETRAKISAANKGRKVSDETRRLHSELKKGKTQSEETKAKRKATWERKKQAAII